MNTYKFLFWATIISFLLFVAYHYIEKENYELSLAQKNWMIDDYKFDIIMINKLIFQTNQTKKQIDSVLIDYDQSDGDYFKITEDTVYLENTYLTFKENKLKSLENNIK
tara:strand:- start:1032 stop:1358 length:327 start_codon:yes stop_codon:yes gene_type:complete